nr:MAG TPA: hypothetical protein [Caudoviricetes sp.]
MGSFHIFRNIEFLSHVNKVLFCCNKVWCYFRNKDNIINTLTY